MGKYQISENNGDVHYVYKIGCNHLPNGIMIGGVASSFNGVFTNEDNVNIESGIGDLRNCTIGDIKEAYDILKNNLKEKNPQDFYEYSECVQKTVLDYFGNYQNINNRLSFFPDEEEIEFEDKKRGTVASLAHQNAAMCIERAMLSQNLLKEIGIDTTFKISGIKKNGEDEAHAFNLITHDNKYYIFDATIPTLRNNVISPLICEIPEDIYKKIISPSSSIGASIHVTHYNPLQDKDYDIIYDAGRSDVYEEPSYTK